MKPRTHAEGRTQGETRHGSHHHERHQHLHLERAIADRIIAAIEAGTPPWRRAWMVRRGQLFPLCVTGERYRGVNVRMLWPEASETGYPSPFRMTCRQPQALGGQVRGGSRLPWVVKFAMFKKDGD